MLSERTDAFHRPNKRRIIMRTDIHDRSLDNGFSFAHVRINRHMMDRIPVYLSVIQVCFNFRCV
jgi:hypothetical protein